MQKNHTVVIFITSNESNELANIIFLLKKTNLFMYCVVKLISNYKTYGPNTFAYERKRPENGDEGDDDDDDYNHYVIIKIITDSLPSRCSPKKNSTVCKIK